LLSKEVPAKIEIVKDKEEDKEEEDDDDEELYLSSFPTITVYATESLQERW